jgi:hypothetical protein
MGACCTLGGYDTLAEIFNEPLTLILALYVLRHVVLCGVTFLQFR